ncbi:NIF system FeS cluster assembly NifU C-terminal protein [Dioscorea alata]|uniref:NIF system FeS cluster assembly NifU C-terminal protein n=2 Tax=Dioscorea alata TaxID=55571 RepID=A0ACB7VJH6_DIOAL|nr:NIF system FeS cluster assembly NifU C-terminal protein [Dioscorea alata]KAH7674255.1 NIF system FeS cluster assembly NifU C-terminal protein [Dioscorea alata]
MALLQPHLHLRSSLPLHLSKSSKVPHFQALTLRNPSSNKFCRKWRLLSISASLPQLDLTEDNIRRVLVDAKSELGQIFDGSVGITGQVDLAEVDGPFVKLSLKGRFWHKRVTVLERIGTYLKNRIPEILEVEIEDEKQLDDSPENF